MVLKDLHFWYPFSTGKNYVSNFWWFGIPDPSLCIWSSTRTWNSWLFDVYYLFQRICTAVSESTDIKISPCKFGLHGLFPRRCLSSAKSLKKIRTSENKKRCLSKPQSFFQLWSTVSDLNQEFRTIDCQILKGQTCISLHISYPISTHLHCGKWEYWHQDKPLQIWPRSFRALFPPKSL